MAMRLKGSLGSEEDEHMPFGIAGSPSTIDLSCDAFIFDEKLYGTYPDSPDIHAHQHKLWLENGGVPNLPCFRKVGAAVTQSQESVLLDATDTVEFGRLEETVQGTREYLIGNISSVLETKLGDSKVLNLTDDGNDAASFLFRDMGKAVEKGVGEIDMETELSECSKKGNLEAHSECSPKGRETAVQDFTKSSGKSSACSSSKCVYKTINQEVKSVTKHLGSTIEMLEAVSKYKNSSGIITNKELGLERGNEKNGKECSQETFKTESYSMGTAILEVDSGHKPFIDNHSVVDANVADVTNKVYVRAKRSRLFDKENVSQNILFDKSAKSEEARTFPIMGRTMMSVCDDSKIENNSYLDMEMKNRTGIPVEKRAVSLCEEEVHYSSADHNTDPDGSEFVRNACIYVHCSPAEQYSKSVFVEPKFESSCAQKTSGLMLKKNTVFETEFHKSNVDIQELDLLSGPSHNPSYMQEADKQVASTVPSENIVDVDYKCAFSGTEEQQISEICSSSPNEPPGFFPAQSSVTYKNEFSDYNLQPLWCLPKNTHMYYSTKYSLTSRMAGMIKESSIGREPHTQPLKGRLTSLWPSGNQIENSLPVLHNPTGDFFQHDQTATQQPEYACNNQRSQSPSQLHNVTLDMPFDGIISQFLVEEKPMSSVSHSTPVGRNPINIHVDGIFDSTWDNGKIEKEKSVFIGRIPKKLQNIENALEVLMRNFLSRFDFAPASLCHVQKVKVCNAYSCKYAFIEFPTDRVAQIVLVASQSDAFIWSVDGCHLSVEACRGTKRCVQIYGESIFHPVAHQQLQPSKIIFLGNIPDSYQMAEALRGFVCKVLLGSSQTASNILAFSIYPVSESPDAYIVFESEVMADALIYRCTKHPWILNELSEKTFICRHPNVIPLMCLPEIGLSLISPQKSLWIGWHPGDHIQIKVIREVIEAALHTISSKGLQQGYIEFISWTPGKAFAHVGLNSEAVSDAVMNEYIGNTSFFDRSCMSYTILRHAQYVRPGATYKSRCGHFQKLHSQSKLMKNVGELHHSGVCSNELLITDMQQVADMSGHEVKTEQQNPQGAGSMESDSEKDFPGQRCDWARNEAPNVFFGEMAHDLESLQPKSSYESEYDFIILGLVSGLNKELLRGALNELFERALAPYGVLQHGVYVVRYLIVNTDFSIVKLCNKETANALLLLGKDLKLSGQKLTLLLPQNFYSWQWKGKSLQSPHQQYIYSALQ